MTTSVVAARELRQHLAEYLDETRSGKQFTITRNGRPAGVLGPPEKEEKNDAEVR